MATTSAMTRRRMLVLLLLVLVVAMVSAAQAANRTSTTSSPSSETETTSSTTTSTSTRTSKPTTTAPASSSDDSKDDDNEDDDSEDFDASSSVESSFSSAEGSTGVDDSSSSEPGTVHAASFSDSDSESSGFSASSSSSALDVSVTTPEPTTAQPTTTNTDWEATTTSSGSWAMTPVTVMHARVQSDEPEWDDTYQTYVSMYGDSFADKYRAALDTANTASIEGALMYVQAEGINVQEQSVKCERKNNMAYVVFYALQVTQTPNSMALYASSAPAIEYCPFVAMDSGRCTPLSGDTDFPDECYQFNGVDGATDIGPCVGGETKDTDFRAPYPDTYWFSLPNSCPLEERADKTDSCRKKNPGGLCAYGSAPDGESCTFAYKILGYIALDDLVGITSMKDSDTGEYYANYSQFCEAGGVEFNATVNADAKTMKVKKALSFWKNPTNSTANAERTQKMIDMYAELAANSDGRMIALPTVEKLSADNPPCYVNSEQCANAEYGCRRVKYFQICEVCTSDDKDDSCVVAPADFTFPPLQLDKGSDVSSSGSESSSAETLSEKDGEESESTSGIDDTSDSDSDSSASDEDAKVKSNSATSITRGPFSLPLWLTTLVSMSAMAVIVAA